MEFKIFPGSAYGSDARADRESERETNEMFVFFPSSMRSSAMPNHHNITRYLIRFSHFILFLS